MATGYTYKLIEEGQTFQEFAKGCARAFGGFVHMRDEPMDAPLRLPDETENNYHAKKLEEETEKLTKLLAFSEEEKITHGEKYIQESIEYAKKAIKKKQLGNSRIEQMMVDVSNWTPPTKDHEEFKRFMLEQLEFSKTTGSYYEDLIQKLKNYSPIDVYNEDVECSRRSIAYHAEELKKELSKNNNRGQWAKQLIESIEKY